jgi:phosphohistidine phosphatase
MQELYLLRHGIAVEPGMPGITEAERPLSEDGVEKMERVALGIARLVGSFGVILTSPLRRARQTADIVAGACECAEAVQEWKHLLPGTSPQTVCANLTPFLEGDRILLVGHEPAIGRLAGHLIGCDGQPVVFKKGALCRIDLETPPPAARGTLVWLLQPKHLRAFAKCKEKP